MEKIEPSQLIIKNLTADINLDSFQSSEIDLTNYLKEDALRDIEYLYSTTKVVIYEGKVIGYFTLLTDTVNPHFLDESIGEKYRYAKMPAVKLARLATHEEYVGLGIGTAMMMEVFYLVVNMIKDVGCRVITVDAKAEARTFYERFTFQTVHSKRCSGTIPMYIDIKDLIEISRP